MTYSIQFTLDGLPKTTNSGGRAHWSVKASEAKLWRRRVVAEALDLRPPSPLHKAKLTLTRYSSAEPDFDGLVSSFKHVVDGLIDAGIIESDKPSVIGQPNYKWEKVKPRMGKISVTVEGEL